MLKVNFEVNDAEEIARLHEMSPDRFMRIVLHNPKTQTYCVMVQDGDRLKLVSWNNAGDDYGNDEWTLI